MSYTHVIMRGSGRTYIRTPILDAKPDAIPAVWDHDLGKAVPYFKPAEPKTADDTKEPEASAENADLRAELEKLTKAEIDQLAQAKFGKGIEVGNKASMIDAFLKLAAEAQEV